MTSIQDGSVVSVGRSNPAGFPASAYIGHYVTVGPGCSLHACTIEDETIIGAGSVVGDGAVVEKHCIIGEQ